MRVFLDISISKAGAVSVKIGRASWVRPATAAEKKGILFININDPEDLCDAADFNFGAAAGPSAVEISSSDDDTPGGHDFDCDGSGPSSPLPEFIQRPKRPARRRRAASPVSDDSESDDDSQPSAGGSSNDGSSENELSAANGSDSGGGSDSNELSAGNSGTGGSSESELSAGNESDSGDGSGSANSESDPSAANDSGSGDSSSGSGSDGSDADSDASTAAVVGRPVATCKRRPATAGPSTLTKGATSKRHPATAGFSTPTKKRAKADATPERPAKDKVAAPTRRSGRTPAPKIRND